jgi:hypothetical protein
VSFFPELDPPVEPPRPVRSDTPPWVNAPKTQLPVPVAVTEVLARRRGVALILQRIDVYREGWMFVLCTRARRPPGPTDEEWGDLVEALQPHGPFRRHPAAASLRLGVELSDGSRVIADDLFHRYPLDDAEPDGPLLTQYPGGGGGSAEEYEQRVDAWLWPPPAGDSLRLFYQWEGLGIAEASITIDTAQLNIAREHVQIIWSE